MANLENVSTDDLRETLAKVDDGDAVKRLMAAITLKEIDQLSQKGAAELYGSSSSWASKWFQRLERLEEEPFEQVVYGEPRDGKSPALICRSEYPAGLTDDFVSETFSSVHAELVIGTGTELYR